ncbi:hypothetical protein [Luteimonas salinilitoris]|uniref:Pyridine nucleotide-disulphide oxidoreductase dimerisation domain-containing protein n=1 Tax=Luteimonas salinilitoris TaxID=3237697 RepID=A0ABV4HPU7_9GAMM
MDRRGCSLREVRPRCGAHLVGPHADEVINPFALAIRYGLTARQLEVTVFAYPSAASDIGYSPESSRPASCPQGDGPACAADRRPGCTTDAQAFKSQEHENREPCPDCARQGGIQCNRIGQMRIGEEAEPRDKPTRWENILGRCGAFRVRCAGMGSACPMSRDGESLARRDDADHGTHRSATRTCYLKRVTNRRWVPV